MGPKPLLPIENNKKHRMRTLNCEKGRLVNNHRSVFVDLCFSMLTKEHCLSSSFPLSCAFQCLLKSIAGSLLSSLPSTCASQCLLKSIVSRVTYALTCVSQCLLKSIASLSSSLSFDLYFSMLAKEHCRPLFRAPFGLVLSSECCKRALASSFRLLFRAPFVVFLNAELLRLSIVRCLVGWSRALAELFRCLVSPPTLSQEHWLLSFESFRCLVSLPTLSEQHYPLSFESFLCLVSLLYHCLVKSIL